MILTLCPGLRFLEYEATRDGEPFFHRMDKLSDLSFIPQIDISLYGFGLYDGKRIGNMIPELMFRQGFPIHPFLKGEVNIGVFQEIGDGVRSLAYWDPLLEPKYIIHSFDPQPVISPTAFEVRVERAYLLFDIGVFSIGIGRNRLRVGPGYRSNLLLSNRGQPLDFLYNAQVKKGPFRFSVFNTGIEAATDEKRIACQRIEIYLSNITIGVTQAVLHSRDRFLKYLNPLEFYYITQRRGGCNRDNLVASGDITYTRGGSKYYLELLFDDPIVFHDSLPFKGGAMLGAYWTDPFGISGSDFRIEMTVIPRWTYTHRFSNHINAMEANGIPLGFFGGNDCIHIYTEFTKYRTLPTAYCLLPTSYFSLILEYLAQGDGTLRKGWEKGERDRFPEPRKIRIPAGYKEERFRMGIEGTFSREKFSMRTGLYLERIKNYRNQDGNDLTRASIKTVLLFNLL